jgi:predicted peptidase
VSRLLGRLKGGVAGLVIAASGCAAAPPQETGFLDRVVVVEGTEYPYQVFVPRDYEAARSWPVILSLHGGGAEGVDGLRQTNGGLPTALRRDPDRYPAIAVFPQSPARRAGWRGLASQIAMGALDATLAEFRTDSSRVYLTGFSMGGYGSWYHLYHYPERFAAALVISGHIGGPFGHPLIAPDTASDPFASFAQRVSGVPTWIFHGDADSVVPIEHSRQMAAALQAIGADVQYTELPGVGHTSAPAYGGADVAEWLLAQRQRDG